MSNRERMEAKGRFFSLQKELARLYVEFSSHRESLNQIIGGYKIETDFATMDLSEADFLIETLKEVQSKIKIAVKEKDFLQAKFEFEE